VDDNEDLVEAGLKILLIGLKWLAMVLVVLDLLLMSMERSPL
jgi:hypothetical protein